VGRTVREKDCYTAAATCALRVVDQQQGEELRLAGRTVAKAQLRVTAAWESGEALFRVVVFVFSVGGTDEAKQAVTFVGNACCKQQMIFSS